MYGHDFETRAVAKARGEGQAAVGEPTPLLTPTPTRASARRGVTLLLATLLVSACSTHVVNTADEWCEQLQGVDLMAKHSPFWAVLPSIQFDGNAIRADFAKKLNEVSLDSVQHRADRMVWVEGTDLYVVNVASLNVIEPETVISEWRTLVANGSKAADQQDACVARSLFSLYDRVLIHTWVWDSLGENVVRDDVTTIETDRRKALRHPI
jgi:hypothetical protein